MVSVYMFMLLDVINLPFYACLPSFSDGVYIHSSTKSLKKKSSNL